MYTTALCALDFFSVQAAHTHMMIISLSRHMHINALLLQREALELSRLRAPMRAERAVMMTCMCRSVFIDEILPHACARDGHKMGLSGCRSEDKFPRGQRSLKGFQFRFRDAVAKRAARWQMSPSTFWDRPATWFGLQEQDFPSSYQTEAAASVFS